MRRKLLLLTLLLVVVLGALLQIKPADWQRAMVWAGLEEPDQSTTGDTGIKATALETRDALRARYRRQPDARFLDASEALTPSGWNPFSDRSLNLELEEAGKWHVSSGNWNVEISGLADFDALLRLSRTAAGLEGRRPTRHTPGDAQGFNVSELFGHLEDNDPVSTARAAGRLAWLGTHKWVTTDTFESRAITLLVEAEAHTESGLLETRSILAEALGYGAHARALAEELPTDNAWRAHMNEDGDRLEQLADQGNVDAHYLHAQWLTDNRDWAGWQERLSSRPDSVGPPLAEASLGYLAGDFGSLELSFQAIPAMLFELLGITDIPDGNSVESGDWAALADRFETRLATGDTLPGESALGREAGADFFRGWYYDSLLRRGFFHLDQRAVPSEAIDFAENLTSREHDRPRKLGRWFHGIADSAPLDLDNGMLGIGLSARALKRTTEDTLEALGWRDMEQYQLVRRMADLLDGRPDHALALTRLTRSEPGFLNLTDRVMRAQADRLEPGYQQVIIARHFGDEERLLTIASDTETNWRARRLALRQLSDSEIDPDTIGAGYESLIAQQPSRLEPYVEYAEFLVQQNERRAAIDILEAWLAGPMDSRDTFDRQEARWKISAIHLELGEPEQALAVLEPFAGSYRGGILRARTRALYALGRKDEAVQVGATYLQRYEDAVEPVVVLAEILWQENEYDNAARLLEHTAERLDTSDWQRDIGKALTDTLGDCTDCIRAAMEAIESVGLGRQSRAPLTGALAENGHNHLAFELYEQYPLEGRRGLQFALRAADQLAAAQDEETANEWLAEHIPDDGCQYFPIDAYSEGAYERIWRLTQPEKCRHRLATYLVLTMALMEEGVATPDRVEAIRNWLPDYGRQVQHYYIRHHVGEIPADPLTTDSTNRHRQAARAYHLGLRAFAEGRNEDGADWFQMALEYGDEQRMETYWAHIHFYQKTQAGHSLSVLAEDGHLPGSGGPPEEHE